MSQFLALDPTRIPVPLIGDAQSLERAINQQATAFFRAGHSHQIAKEKALKIWQHEIVELYRKVLVHAETKVSEAAKLEEPVQADA
jgi:hypothetical protein